MRCVTPKHDRKEKPAAAAAARTLCGGVLPKSASESELLLFPPPPPPSLLRYLMSLGRREQLPRLSDRDFSFGERTNDDCEKFFKSFKFPVCPRLTKRTDAQGTSSRNL